MNFENISTLIGVTINDLSHVIKQGWQNTRPFMTGCLIYTDNAFSVCDGIVRDIGMDDKNKLYSISIEYTYDCWIRYCMLQNCNVSVGDEISKGDKIGSTYNGILRFEYCTDEFSTFPFRSGDVQLYKHDPLPILTGETELPEIDDDGDIIVTDEVLPEDMVEEIEKDVEDE